MTARIVLLVTSPRLPAGLLTAAAWDLLRSHPVLAAAGHALIAPLRSVGVEVRAEEGTPATPIALSGAPSSALLAAAAEHGTVVWLAAPDGDPELARQLGLRLAREPGLAELELMYGSWDPPGARLLDAVSVIDRLVSPGGDPWKRQQTHASLAQYLLEEAYEAHDAIEAGDLAGLREELGDLLLQVVLHARLAEQLPEEQRWSIDDVAGDFVAKMIRRNPHVFGGVDVADVAEIVDNWERIKREEKARSGALDGVVLAQPALSLAAKVLARAERAGIEVPVPGPPEAVNSADAGALGEALLGLVAAARAAGVDAEAALRRATLGYADRLRAAERRPGQEP
jgi:XTP/dITP diphosphohydrolase